MADDLGYECLNCYGGTSYRTPNLDRLAGQGIRFTHAYAQPLCTPTRVQLMTGQYNSRNWRAFGVMDPKQRTFGHMMTGAGYRTCIAGKWQLHSYNPPDFEPEWRGKGQHPNDAGFHEYCLWHPLHTEDKGSRYGDPSWLENGKLFKNEKGKYGEDVSADYLMRFIERSQKQPFFAYYPMALTHGPFNPTPRSAAWNTQRLKNDPAFFADMVSYMDDVVGRLVDRLDKLALRERTLILFYSDNGTDKSITSRMGDKIVKGGKGLTTDAGTRVPLIASWKGRTPQGKVLDDLVDSTDFVPTIAGACGAKPPVQPVDGVSFLAQLEGKKGNPREWIYSWYDPRPGWAKAEYSLIRSARDKRFKLYDDGRFYDIAADELEKNPLPPGAGGPAREKLQSVLNRYKS